MPMTLSQIESEVQKLPLSERVALAEHIISDFDPENEKRWIDEAERRYDQYLAGRMKSKSAENVFRDAFERLKVLK